VIIRAEQTWKTESTPVVEMASEVEAVWGEDVKE
jgi:hypothetical protein